MLDRVGVQPVERQVPCGAPAREPPRQAGGRFRLVPAGGDAQHALAAKVVRQVLKERQGVRIGPVQVLEGDDQPGAGAGTEPAEQPDDRLCPGDRRGEAGRGQVVRGGSVIRLAECGKDGPQRGQPRIEVGVRG